MGDSAGLGFGGADPDLALGPDPGNGGRAGGRAELDVGGGGVARVGC